MTVITITSATMYREVRVSLQVAVTLWADNICIVAVGEALLVLQWSKTYFPPSHPKTPGIRCSVGVIEKLAIEPALNQDVPLVVP